MAAEALTQAEIDALLSGAPLPQAAAETGGGGPSMITAEEEDTVKNYAQLVANSSQNVIGTLTGESVSISIGDLEEVDAKTVNKAVSPQSVVTTFNYRGLVRGSTVLTLDTPYAMQLANQMTGGGGEGEFGDLEESALSETLSQVINGANTELAGQFGGDIQLDIPDIVTNPGDPASILPDKDRKEILVTYNIKSKSLSGSFKQLLPRSFVESLAVAAKSTGTVAESHRDYGIHTGAAPILSHPATFEPAYAGGGMGFAADTGNLELILDISLDIKVELGRSFKKSGKSWN